MQYVYIGFMLAIGACLGVGTCLFIWRRPKLAGPLLLYTLYLLAFAYVGLSMWATHPHPLSALAAWLQTRNGVIATIVTTGIAVMLIAGLLHSPNHELAALCRTCKHPEYEHKSNKCFHDGCSCRWRPNIKGAVIALSLAVFVFVLLIILRGGGH